MTLFDSTGGKALESDILQKRIEFFKTRSEHIKDIGTEITFDKGVTNPTVTATVYTVPANRTAFIYFISHSLSSVASGFTSNRSIMYLDTGQKKAFGILSVVDDGHANQDTLYNPMFRLDTGRQIVVHQTNSTVTGSTRAFIYGIAYEIPKETPLF